MSRVTIRFNANSRSPNSEQACRLAKSIGYSIDKNNKNIYVVVTKNINHEIFNLFHLVEQLKGTTAYIDDKEVDDLTQLEFIVNCEKRYYCKGECENLEKWEKIIKLLKNSNNDLDESYTEQDFNVEKHTDILIESSDETFSINTKYLEEDFIEFCSMYLDNCLKFNKEYYINILRSASKNLKLKRISYADIRKRKDNLIENEGLQSIEKIIQLFGDEIELRLRKVLSEYTIK